MSDRDAWGAWARDRGLAPVGAPHEKRDDPEARFQWQVCALATALGWWWWHDEDSRRNRAGLPDLLLFRSDRLIVAELKVGRNRCTDAQIAFLARYSWIPGVEAVEWRPDRPDRGKWTTVETAEPLGRYAMGEIERRLR